jgi:beta-glucosidase/6-phospho-beta-glucosidase/beta-galactosidase
VLATVLPSSATPVETTADKALPRGFLWGVATAAHQIEGNNTNSDYWFLENIKPTTFTERSGDACDSYHRYEEDIRLLAGLGFNTYRFSIEWARIEPSQDNSRQPNSTTTAASWKVAASMRLSRR